MYGRNRMEKKNSCSTVVLKLKSIATNAQMEIAAFPDTMSFSLYVPPQPVLTLKSTLFNCSL